MSLHEPQDDLAGWRWRDLFRALASWALSSAWSR
jgi:hypothetical protein